jgi:hypothetical protein
MWGGLQFVWQTFFIFLLSLVLKILHGVCMAFSVVFILAGDKQL